MIQTKTTNLGKQNPGRITGLFIIAAAAVFTTALFVASTGASAFAQGENQTQGQDENMTSSFNTTAASTRKSEPMYTLLVSITDVPIFLNSSNPLILKFSNPVNRR